MADPALLRLRALTGAPITAARDALHAASGDLEAAAAALDTAGLAPTLQAQREAERRSAEAQAQAQTWEEELDKMPLIRPLVPTHGYAEGSGIPSARLPRRGEALGAEDLGPWIQRAAHQRLRRVEGELWRSEHQHLGSFFGEGLPLVFDPHGDSLGPPLDRSLPQGHHPVILVKDGPYAQKRRALLLLCATTQSMHSLAQRLAWATPALDPEGEPLRCFTSSATLAMGRRELAEIVMASPAQRRRLRQAAEMPSGVLQERAGRLVLSALDGDDAWPLWWALDQDDQPLALVVDLLCLGAA